MLSMAQRERQSSSPWVRPLGAVLSEALRGRRKKWLADVTELDAATVSRILNGVQLPSLDQLQAICDALDLSPRQVLARIGYFTDNEARYDALPGHVRRMIDAMVDQLSDELVLQRDDGTSAVPGNGT